MGDPFLILYLVNWERLLMTDGMKVLCIQQRIPMFYRFQPSDPINAVRELTMD